MQSKWVKFCSKYCAKICRPSWIDWLAIFLGGPFFASFAWATLTVQPSTGGSLSGPTNGGGTFYYFVKTANTSGSVSPPNFIFFQVLDVTQTSVTDSGFDNYFEVLLTTTANYSGVTGTQQAVVTVTAQGSGTAAHPGPIASVNGSPCSTNNNNCQAQNQVSNNSTLPNNRFYAAKFFPGVSNNQIRIGFYLSEICSDYFAATTTAAQGCTSTSPSTVTQPTSGSPTVMSLQFSITTAPDPNLATIPSGNALDSTSSAIPFSIQVDTPQLNCQSSSLNQDYAPGDGGISFTPNGISISPANCAGCAPALNLYVVGNDHNATPVVGPSFQSGNAVVGQIVPQAYAQGVGGFTNSTSSSDHPYQISFVGVDQAGVYTSATDSNGNPTCTLQNVRSAAIQGYLGKSNCFIATAAFGSPESGPVVLLKRFRDHLLLKFSGGRAFVKWYYRWSPPAADWLIQNSLFRVPVLLLLAPFEIFAWLCLHPFIAGLGLLSGILLLVSTFVKSRLRREKFYEARSS